MTKQYLSGCIADIETLKQELSCWDPETESCGSSSQMTRVKSKIVKISDINTIPQATPFVEIIKYRLRYSSDDIVAHYKGEDYSYYKIVNRACKLANKLKSYGFNQDDKTGIIIENSINWIVSFVAVLFFGRDTCINFS